MISGGRSLQLPMYKFLKNMAICVMGLATAGCVSLSGQRQGVRVDALANHRLTVANDTLSCRDSLGELEPPAGLELDAGNISLLSWNVKKGSLESWQDDLVDLASNKDLVLIQEATLDKEFTEALSHMDHWVFGPGYASQMQLTGVMTMSKAAPVAHCNLTTLEPWLNTPKATTVTEYGLTNTEDTLVVVNIHAINFSLGVTHYREQMDQVRAVLAEHRGPVILSGDFNTWRGERVRVVETLISDLGLVPLEFAEDHRTRVFGQHLDHIFVRGLIPRTTGTQSVRTSDHNPLSAELVM